MKQFLKSPNISTVQGFGCPDLSGQEASKYPFKNSLKIVKTAIRMENLLYVSLLFCSYICQIFIYFMDISRIEYLSTGLPSRKRHKSVLGPEKHPVVSKTGQLSDGFLMF